mmetsp:Transcript_30418/g.37445  ORF Transcript_30418/g.37445 Transcript_30418/m.37445 type:complete len:83 (+) Transcript_30418:436-684(+)
MTLLNEPGLLAQDGTASMSAALWFYMFPQAPKPSMHELANQTYQPSAYDTTTGLGAYFGATTMVINGGLECTTDDGEENENS